jgi:protein-disulfide isomerase
MDNLENSSQPPENLENSGETPESRSGDVIVINQTTLYYFVIAAVFFIGGVVVGWVAFASSTSRMLSEVKTVAANAASEAVGTAISGLAANGAAAAAPTTIPRQTVSVGVGPSWGPTDAKVTIVEFSDFQCPFCERFYTQTYALIRSTYGDRVRFVYRHYPLTSIHPDALPSALAAECAKEQGKFWEYHDYLFSHQNNLSRDALISYATTVGVPDVKQFTTCFDEQKYLSTIQTDIKDANGYCFGTCGTPTFFINGNIFVGAQPYELFVQAIDSELAQANS